MHLLGAAILVLIVGGLLTSVALPGPVLRTQGRLVDGRGQGALVVTHLELQPIVGYEPYAGTANLRLNRRVALGRPIASLPYDWKTYDIWPVKVGSLDCHVIWGRHWQRDPKLIEVIAPVRLRDMNEGFEIRHQRALLRRRFRLAYADGREGARFPRRGAWWQTRRAAMLLIAVGRRARRSHWL